MRGRHRGSLSLLLPAVVPPSPVLPHKFSPSKNSRPAKSVPHSRQRQKRSRERWGSLYKDLRPHSNLKSLGPNAFNNSRRCNTFDLVPTKSSPVEIRTFPCIGSRIYLLVNSDQAVFTIVPLSLQTTFSGLFCSWCTLVTSY